MEKLKHNLDKRKYVREYIISNKGRVEFWCNDLCNKIESKICCYSCEYFTLSANPESEKLGWCKTGYSSACVEEICAGFERLVFSPYWGDNIIVKRCQNNVQSQM